MRKKIIALTPLMKVSLMLFLIMELFLIGCGSAVETQPSEEKAGKKMIVKKGDRVKVEYVGRLKDGTIFDKSKAGEPLEFTAGSGQIIPGFDKAVEGMRLNEEKKVTIKAEDAYGKREESLVREFPRSSLPKNFKPEKGMVLRLRDQSGRTIPGTIVDMTEGTITIDLNHPLAGKDLIFDIKVVDIE